MSKLSNHEARALPIGARVIDCHGIRWEHTGFGFDHEWECDERGFDKYGSSFMHINEIIYWYGPLELA